MKDRLTLSRDASLSDMVDLLNRLIADSGSTLGSYDSDHISIDTEIGDVIVAWGLRSDPSYDLLYEEFARVASRPATDEEIAALHDAVPSALVILGLARQILTRNADTHAEAGRIRLRVSLDTLSRLGDVVKLKPIITRAGLSYDSIMTKVSRRRAGSSTPDLSLTESIALERVLRDVAREIIAVVGEE